MTNPYYNPSGVPVTRAQLSSAAMRSEMASVAAGFDKLAPTLTANALLHVNAAGTQQTAHASITVSAAGALAGITDLTTTGNTVLGNASTDTLNVGNGGIVKDDSGNVGIGTASPVNKVDVVDTLDAPLVVGVTNISTGSSAKARLHLETAAGAWFVENRRTGGDLAFGVGSTTFLRLDTSGNHFCRLQGVVPTLNNQEAVMTFPDNSTLRLTFKGTDGTERYIDLALTT